MHRWKSKKDKEVDKNVKNNKESKFLSSKYRTMDNGNKGLREIKIKTAKKIKNFTSKSALFARILSIDSKQ